MQYHIVCGGGVWSNDGGAVSRRNIKMRSGECQGGAGCAPGNSLVHPRRAAPPIDLLTILRLHATRASITFFYSQYFIALFVPQLDGFIKSLRITVTTT